MDDRSYYHRFDHYEEVPRPTTASYIVWTILGLLAINYLVQYLDLAVLPFHELLWNALVYIIPSPLLLDRARRQELRESDMLSQSHAAKSDALRRLLGIGGNALLQKLPAGDAFGLGGVTRRLSMATGLRPTVSDVPAGLGNWDNSCYQNSVLQALASLEHLGAWLKSAEPTDSDASPTTNTALQEMIAKLRSTEYNGKHIWTPAKLKNMSSWQQQDAQEYFSKVMDELDKEAKKAFGQKKDQHGLEEIMERDHKGKEQESKEEAARAVALRNPLEGLTAQRISCIRCGFSEGYSMIPFNCLTVPLGTSRYYDLQDCLTDYTKSEDIEGVECRSCTLMQAAERLQKLLVNAPFQPEQTESTEALTASVGGQAMQLPPEIRAQIVQRLQAIEKALDEDDFSDKTLKQDCQLSPKSYASTVKRREAVLGRAPQSLVIHINRSVFDELTGMQRKNYAEVQYPMLLDLRPWLLEPGSSPATFRLSAVVQHYGRHENGHYICYRKHEGVPPLTDDEPDPEAASQASGKERWWRLSDEDVSPVTEEEALGQAGAFMLFYERLDESFVPTTDEDIAEAAAVPLPPDEITDWDLISAQPSTAAPSLVTSSAQSVVSDTDTDLTSEAEPDGMFPLPAGKQPIQPQISPLLKTASPTSMRGGLGLERPSLMSV
ncbi:putative ubiquitin specific protease, papain-like cysteine peptidase superfamily [Septoria linicola]|nr:putative ubiquitin specific protease, papain-like cysteine peptidase superfamily [Septoria linicola]